MRIKLTCTCFLFSVPHADGDSRQRVSLVMSQQLLLHRNFCLRSHRYHLSCRYCTPSITISQQTAVRLPIILTLRTYVSSKGPTWRYEDVPLSTRRAHVKLAAADTDEVSTKTLVFALNRTSSKIPGSWQGDQLDFASENKVPKEASVSAQQQGATVKQQVLVADKGFPTDPRLATSLKHHGR